MDEWSSDRELEMKKKIDSFFFPLNQQNTQLREINSISEKIKKQKNEHFQIYDRIVTQSGHKLALREKKSLKNLNLSTSSIIKNEKKKLLETSARNINLKKNNIMISISDFDEPSTSLQSSFFFGNTVSSSNKEIQNIKKKYQKNKLNYLNNLNSFNDDIEPLLTSNQKKCIKK